MKEREGVQDRERVSVSEEKEGVQDGEGKARLKGRV